MTQEPQTPELTVQHFLLVGTAIYTIDFFGVTRLACVCPSVALAQVVTQALAEHHGVQAKISNLDLIDGATLPDFDTSPR